MKKVKSFVTCLFVLISISLFSAAGTSCYANSSNQQLMIFPQDLSTLQSDLSTLKNGDDLYLEIYELDDPAIESTLLTLANNGVKIFIVCNNFAKPSAREGYILNHEKEFGKNYDITVYPSTDKFDLTHSKTFTAFNNLTQTPIFSIIMTANLIDDSQAPVSQTWNSSIDFALYTTDPNIESETKSIINEDITNSEQSTKDTPSLSAESGNSITGLVVSPVNSMSKLENLINSAQSSIYIYMENITETNLLDDLANKAEDGVAVKVLAEDSIVFGKDWNKTRISALYSEYDSNNEFHSNMNVILAQDPNNYIHAKVVVVDNRYVYIGSINMSDNSINNDREIGIIIDNPQIAKKIVAKFNTDWAYFSNNYKYYYPYQS